MPKRSIAFARSSMFSHPADFTPVCTTEFIAFSEIFDELKKRSTQLLGLSVDSASSHIAWIRNIEEKMGVRVPFPIIADLDKKVAMLYGSPWALAFSIKGTRLSSITVQEEWWSKALRRSLLSTLYVTKVLLAMRQRFWHVTED